MMGMAQHLYSRVLESQLVLKYLVAIGLSRSQLKKPNSRAPSNYTWAGRHCGSEGLVAAISGCGRMREARPDKGVDLRGASMTIVP